MTWTSCGRVKCRYHHTAEVELNVRGKLPRVAVWMKFNKPDNIGYTYYGGQTLAEYPCLRCKYYDPTKLDFYTEEA